MAKSLFPLLILKLLRRHLWLHLLQIKLLQEKLAFLVNFSTVFIYSESGVTGQCEQIYQLFLVVQKLVEVGRQVLNL